MDTATAWNNLVGTIRSLRLSADEHEVLKARLKDMLQALQSPAQPTPAAPQEAEAKEE